MRRQGGHYGNDSGGGGGHSYGSAGAQDQQNISKSGNYQGRHQEQQQVGEKEERHQQHHNQWRWERDASQSKLPQAAMSLTAHFPEVQGREGSRSYYQNQRLDPRIHSERIPAEKQGGVEQRSQPREEDMEIGYEDDRVMTFEGIELRFIDDIMKLSKEQTDAEDAENKRHTERINAIDAQYEQQLVALRARHASRREEFLRRESQARQQQYQQLVSMEQHSNSGIPNDPRGYNAGQPLRAYSSEYYSDSYRERGRFPGNTSARDRDQGYEPNVLYPRGRAYDTSSRFY